MSGIGGTSTSRYKLKGFGFQVVDRRLFCCTQTPRGRAHPRERHTIFRLPQIESERKELDGVRAHFRGWVYRPGVVDAAFPASTTLHHYAEYCVPVQSERDYSGENWAQVREKADATQERSILLQPRPHRSRRPQGRGLPHRRDASGLLHETTSRPVVPQVQGRHP